MRLGDQERLVRWFVVRYMVFRLRDGFVDQSEPIFPFTLEADARSWSRVQESVLKY